MLSARRNPWLRKLVIFLGLGLGFEFGAALKVPFRMNDVLPVLPQYMGSLAPDNVTIKWKGACFNDNEAKIDFFGAGDRGISGGLIHLSTAASHSWTCMDLYVFATTYRVTWDYYFSTGDHTLQIESWEEPPELEYVKQHEKHMGATFENVINHGVLPSIQKTCTLVIF